MKKPTQTQISAAYLYEVRTFNASREQARFDAMRQIDPSAFVLTLTPPNAKEASSATNQQSLFEVSR